MPKSNPPKQNGSPAKSGTKHSIKQTASSYDIYHILERELVLKEKGIPSKISYASGDDWKNYGDLSHTFPPLPSRYESLDLSATWFIKRNGKYGIRLEGLSKAVSRSWKTCDAEVHGYVTDVAEIVKERRDEILSRKSGMKSISPSSSYGLKSSDLSPKFERAKVTEDAQNTCDRGVILSSSPASSIGVHNAHDVPNVVHDAGIQPQLINPHDMLRLSFQQQMKLPYSNIAICNAGFNANMGRILGSSDAHQTSVSAYAMASDPKSTRFIKYKISDEEEGPDIKAASQYDNISYPTVKHKTSEEDPDIKAAG